MQSQLCPPTTDHARSRYLYCTLNGATCLPLRFYLGEIEITLSSWFIYKLINSYIYSEIDSSGLTGGGATRSYTFIYLFIGTMYRNYAS